MEENKSANVNLSMNQKVTLCFDYQKQIQYRENPITATCVHIRIIFVLAVFL